MAATNVNNSLTKTQNGKSPAFSVYLNQDSTKRWLNNMIGGDTAQSQRFMTAIISVVSNNPALAKCDHISIVTAALAGEALKLSPAPQMGQYYMVPFNDKKKDTSTAVFVLGYKGYIQLAIRSGHYRKLNVLAIKAGELVRFDPLTEDIEINLINDDTVREAAETTGYYAMFEYMNGFRKAMYWSKEKMLAHADKYSPAFKADKYQQLMDGKIPQSEAWKYSSFWYKDFDGMAYKTMLRQLISKWGIMSIEMQDAYSKDNHAITEKMEPEYISGVEGQPEVLPALPETQTISDDNNKPAPEDDPFLSNNDLPVQGTPEYEAMSRQADLDAAQESAV